MKKLISENEKIVTPTQPTPRTTRSHFRSKIDFLKCIIYSFLFIILIGSCYTPTEGCLNIDATNYNASADEPCDDCCVFPNLNLRITHSITTEGTFGQDSVINHSADSTFNNVDDNFFQIKGMEFYLSDFQLVMSDGSIAEVEDEMTFMIYEDAISQTSKDTTVKDDFVLVSRSSFNYTIGEFRQPGTFTELRFTVGISENLSSIDVDTLDSSHPLSSENLMHFGTRDSGFVYQEFSLVKDTTTNSTEVEVYQMGKETDNSIQLTFFLTGELEPGFDAEIPLIVNYSTWLKGINFASNDVETIKSIIVSNTAEAFEIGE